jgi:hypothetical protein
MQIRKARGMHACCKEATCMLSYGSGTNITCRQLRAGVPSMPACQTTACNLQKTQSQQLTRSADSTCCFVRRSVWSGMF